MNKLCFVLALMMMCVGSEAQNYLGGGNASGITVSASSSFQDTSWGGVAAAPINTITDQGMLAPYFDAARFLTQATIGYEESHVQELLNMPSYEAWIDAQFAKDTSYTLPKTEEILAMIEDTILASNPNAELYRRPEWKHFNYAWWEINTLNDDLLRHRVACALSEILVISRNSDLSGYGDALASYYDVLLKHAFGNYRDLLFDVSIHPAMGFYLSHLNNPKTDLAIGLHPDENYAREVMQLFSIGLYELNLDGSRKQNAQGDIPTYNNEDIAEFAKVFTGLGIGDVLPELDDPNDMYDDTATFGMGLWKANVTIPMRMYETDDPNTNWRDEDQHEDGPKDLLNGFTIPDGQTGMQDIDDAIGNLFDHDNVGPFLALRLIQRLVKSNPTAGYIQRVATAFNGSGPYGTTRGDMKSVIKAILLDDEARQVSYQEDQVNSRLKEPLFRYTHFSRAVDKYNANGFYWNIGQGFYEETKQAILASPSVFNFFLYDDAPNGPIGDMGLVAPEFKIHDSRSSIGYMNNVYNWASSWGSIMGTWEGDIMEHTDVDWDEDELYLVARDTEAYINWLDKKLLAGSMSDGTREIIRTALDGFEKHVSWHNYQENRTRLGLYLALISPDYCLMR